MVRRFWGYRNYVRTATGISSITVQVESGPKFTAVLCYDESRWGRAIDAEENTYRRFHFRKHGIDAILVKTVIDPSHEFAPMLKSFESVQASQYSKKLSELTLRGAMNNGKYSSGGTAPYGFRRMAFNMKTNAVRMLQDGEWCVSGQEKVAWVVGSEDEVSTVKFIFQERSKGTAYISIAETLNRKGVPCPKRGRWKNHDRKWSTITIKTILENPAYYGARAYNRNSMSKIQATAKSRSEKRGVRYPHWRNPKHEWTIEENAHEGIVPKELWEKANSFRHDSSKRQPNQYTSKGEFLLTGKIRCVKCGFAFQGHTTRSKGKVYRKYVDGGWTGKRVCEFYGISKEKIETLAITAVQETINDMQVLDKLEAAMKKKMKEMKLQTAAANRNLLSARDQMAGRRTNILAAVSRTSNPRVVDSLLSELESLDKQIDTNEKELLAEKSGAEKIYNIEELVREVREFCLTFSTQFSEADAPEKKALLQKCLSEVLIDREKKIARIRVREVPAIHQEVANLLQKERAHTEVVCARGSGDRT